MRLRPEVASSQSSLGRTGNDIVGGGWGLEWSSSYKAGAEVVAAVGGGYDWWWPLLTVAVTVIVAWAGVIVEVVDAEACPCHILMVGSAS